MIVNLICAVSSECTIGRDGKLPWKQSADLQNFKRITMGHELIMGRNTYESMGGLFAPQKKKFMTGRSVSILSRTKQPMLGVKRFESLDKAVIDAYQRRVHQVFICGGASVFQEALEIIDRAYVTLILASVPGDTHFKGWNIGGWDADFTGVFEADARNEYPYRFLTLTRP